MKLRIGIIGNGRIASRFIPECRMSGEEIEITCVYNPTFSSAVEFAMNQAIPMATADIDVLIEQSDAVYIAVPHQYHYDYAKRMLEAGKHVFCEKPLCFVAEEARELYSLAEEKNLVLMEGIKTNYAPGFIEILERVKRGEIGEVIDVEAAFTRIPIANTRECWDSEFGGSFLEFGSYAMLPIVKLYGTEKLQSEFTYIKGETGVDTYVKAKFTKIGEDGEIIGFGTAKTGLGVKSEGQLLISGTKGYILVPSPWWLTKKYEICREDPAMNETVLTEFLGAGLRYEIEAFVKRISDEAVLSSLTKEESIWMAEQMEHFLEIKKEDKKEDKKAEGKSEIGIWAHRGCCFKYPENTIPAFLAAAKLPGLKGIELDIQLTKDGEMVVIHDEKVDATTTSKGAVADYTLSELQAMKITGRHRDEVADIGEEVKIPTIREVFEALMPYLRQGLLINIELKNSNVRYEGMEKKIIDLVYEMGLAQNIIYSSFLPESMGVIKELDPEAKTGILGGWIHWCTQKMREFHADAVHPYTGGMDITKGAYKAFEGIPVRAW
nr:Gfo/Idh/MocA family oxidoreductase [Lachnospiraceae bacterium]